MEPLKSTVHLRARRVEVVFFGGFFMNSADIVWILISSALVLVMTPGLAFFYGGMVKRKNVINTMMIC